MLPSAWLDEAVAWCIDGAAGDACLWADIGGIYFPLAACELSDFLRRCRRSSVLSVTVYAGEDGRLRAVNGRFLGIVPSLSLAAGGGSRGEAELLGLFDDLKQIARRLAPELAHAFVAIQPTFLFAPHDYTSSYYEEGGAAPNLVEKLCSEYVFDAFPYQVLGPGHLRRLGDLPAGIRSLDGGRAELGIGDPASWLLDPWLSEDETAPFAGQATPASRPRHRESRPHAAVGLPAHLRRGIRPRAGEVQPRDGLTGQRTPRATPPRRAAASAPAARRAASPS